MFWLDSVSSLRRSRSLDLGNDNTKIRFSNIQSGSELDPRDPPAPSGAPCAPGGLRPSNPAAAACATWPTQKLPAYGAYKLHLTIGGTMPAPRPSIWPILHTNSLHFSSARGPAPAAPYPTTAPANVRGTRPGLRPHFHIYNFGDNGAHFTLRPKLHFAWPWHIIVTDKCEPRAGPARHPRTANGAPPAPTPPVTTRQPQALQCWHRLT